MSLRFFRCIKIAPGLSLNLSKGGPSLSIGPRGMKYTIGASGQRYTVGLPGTGLYYTERLGRAARRARSRGPAQEAPPQRSSRVAAADKLDLNFFERLTVSAAEQHFVDGMRAFQAGNDAAAIKLLDVPDAVPDALFVAGILSLKAEQYDAALELLRRADEQPAALGQCFTKYGVAATIQLPITERTTLLIAPDHRGVLLASAEVKQAQGNWHGALACVEALRGTAPDDPIGRLSLCEILVEDQADAAAYQRVVECTGSVANTGEVDTALLYWKGCALHRLGVLSAARDTLTLAFARKQGRDAGLLHDIQYERACVYEALGQRARARTEFGRIYAAEPGYRDVARRLGIGTPTGG
ncbi:MAG TPA: DUF4236 domain-containing protein [Nevskiaceae bacterium]|nr:DUF4236 domain-containing protein [Nevskiaceae bacterium]